MGTILFECPVTGRPISTGIETEPISFCRLSKTWIELYCPECGRFHGAKIWLDHERSASACFSKSAIGPNSYRRHRCNVRYWHFSDIPRAQTNVRCGGKADMMRTGRYVG